jgi:hypothetical protein
MTRSRKTRKRRTAQKHQRRRRVRRVDPAELRAAKDNLTAAVLRLVTTLIERYLPPVAAGSGDYLAASRKHAEVEELERLYKK